MILFDLIYCVIIFGLLFKKLWDIYNDNEQCLIKNKSHDDNPYYYDPISMEFVLYSLIIIHSLFMIFAFLRMIEGIIYFDRKKKRRDRILERVDQLRSVYYVGDNDDSVSTEQEGLYVPISLRNKSFSKSYASIWDISGKKIKAKNQPTMKSTLLDKDGGNPTKDREDSDEEMCVICMDKFEKGQIVVKLECNHIYHDKCALEWFDESATCPVCRKSVTKLKV